MTSGLLAQFSVDASAVSAVLFYLFAGMAGGGGLAVVFSRNIVRCAVALLFTLLGVAGLYFLLNAEFLAAVQLVVYVGGTLILIVFGVMLTARTTVRTFEATRGEMILAGAMAAVLLATIVAALPIGAKSKLAGRAFPTGHPLPTGDAYPVALLGEKLLGDYLLPFELSSVLLLAAMIGAAYLARARPREPGRPQETPVRMNLSERARSWS